MAPKKRKPKGKAGEVAKGQGSAVAFVSEREQYLQKEFAVLTEHINTHTQRVQHFQLENDFLDKEAQQIRETSKAYLTYLTKRSLRCQNAIITLNDQNRSDLAQVQTQKEELTSQYTDKEKEMRSQLIEMETKYSLMHKEVEELQPFKELQLDQLSRIRELEKELLVMRIQHSEQMHKVKSQFLHRKAEYETESQQKVQTLAKQAEKEAVRSLIQHTKQVKAENWRLRQELLDLIRRAQVLKAFMCQLREQQEQLLREHKYSQALLHTRGWLRPRRPQPVSRLDCSLTAKSSRRTPAHATSEEQDVEKEARSPSALLQAESFVAAAAASTRTRGEKSTTAASRKSPAYTQSA